MITHIAKYVYADGCPEIDLEKRTVQGIPMTDDQFARMAAIVITGMVEVGFQVSEVGYEIIMPGRTASALEELCAEVFSNR